MTPLKIGWIDYSSEHKNKVMAVLDLLSDKGAIDELGTGSIRDGFGDIFFPGTSTIQTRAKYFFIVSYLLMELEKEPHSSYKDFLEELAQREVDLIDTLVETNAEGVIGARARKKLKRKPSSIYWNGLRTFEFFKHAHLSLNNYAKAFLTLRRKQEADRSLGHEEGDIVNAEGAEYNSTFWQCLLPPFDWRESLSMDLTYQEAVFMKEKILTSPKSKDSLFAFLLKEEAEKVRQVDKFEAIGKMFPLPDGIRQDYEMAERFSKFISGANIRYNVLLSNHENSVALDKWRNWLDSSFVKHEFASFRYSDVLFRLQIYNPLLKRFLGEWQKTVLSGHEQEIDKLLVKREIELKSKDRAKLFNSKNYAYEDGSWLGAEKLQYRYPNSKILLQDIFDGLEDGYA
ncbi:DUF6361 family protein [Halobacillus salinarum]|uniref:DUF6361 family protein n=1 Tax=Halobacillus salinarum TaxID=2932257 RepID=A0ABY4EK93_9BACI|nr:DUF6361 family protein [Halobacillus salinarum]UOQ44850.1 DUF6361 family protein [Halobacillus salinarum]